ncbi:glycerol-3-phosphate O-acyltransferase [Verticillium alfalfae VaMs.102]|uniref:Glycerol-3-phosphate O-acyltransferase n=1 Tax=Verticillium alfalfae (strain VaMs.102 / ATCC MYA-4576 / FGSC 10136) TaxID=526221 RepID=C9ST19_VERA1|nr:glycerol-3-phosphate O-acyltransferase [Verticillium alfalfae VaMs.102]EEY21934.1 glycerol-3-phosphate O-acyltransferase [Verticillium alfalfae VaMs.102]
MSEQLGKAAAAARGLRAAYRRRGREELYPMVPWKYDLFLWVMGVLVDLFFREVHPRGTWKVPRTGPVLFVAAPHANQFVDALVLYRTLRNEAGRRVSLLIAQKSVHGFIGWGSRQVGSVPVGRPQDAAKPGSGTIYLPDPDNDPTLIRGVGTKFGEGEGEVGGMLFLPSTKGHTGASIDIAEIISPEEIRIKRAFKGKIPMRQLTGRDDGPAATLGGVPRHKDPDIGLKIVPVGMNYFHAHKFRSRAVIEFGAPYEIPKRIIDMYRNNQRREAIGELLDTTHQILSAVTVSTPDYDTLMLIQAARRLYNPTGKKLPLPVVIELNRRLALGYERYKDDERIVHLSKAVKEYNRQLRYVNLRDHQVQYGKMSTPKVILTLIYRIGKLLTLLVGVLPGLILFAPVFIAAKVISIRKAKQALAGSTVKIQGRDVMATWKLMVAIFFAPTLYNFYSAVVTWRVYVDHLWGTVPAWVPWWTAYLVMWPLMVGISFAALRFGEVGMDIFKSLRPLVLCLNPASSYNIHHLRERRAQLSTEVTDVINTLGPDMFPDFDKTRLVADSQGSSRGTAATADGRPSTPPYQQQQQPPYGQRRDSDASSNYDAQTPPSLGRRNTTMSSRGLPRNESFSNIGGVGIFSTRAAVAVEKPQPQQQQRRWLRLGRVPCQRVHDARFAGWVRGGEQEDSRGDEVAQAEERRRQED